MAKLCRIFCLLFAFATFSIAFPVEDVIPILRPSPSNPEDNSVSENDAQGESESEHVAVAPYPASASEDATDFPILKPESSGDNDADNEEYEEYGMERPRPQGSYDEDEAEGADEGPLIPRPRPEGSEVDDQDQAAIVYPGFYRVKRNVEDEIPAEEPEPEEEASGSDYDYENGDYFVERPLPEGFSDENENGSGGYHEGDEDDTVVVYPEEGDERRKRSPDDTYEDIPAPGVDGGQDDTVVVNAASCEDLRKKCYETGDPLVCMTLEENCGDEPNDYVNCVLAAKTGKHSAKCRHLSKD
jgi:hypothetical protein